MKPQDIAQKIKAGRGWLVVRNSATLANTDYERVADEIVDALNKSHAYPKLVGTIKHYLERFKDHEALLTREQVEAIRAMRSLLRELGENK